MAAQWDTEPGDPGRNMRKARDLFARLPAGTDVVVFPELWTTGYDFDAPGAPDGPGGPAAAGGEAPASILAELAGLAVAGRTNIVAGSVPVETSAGVFNTSLIYDRNGRCLAQYRKIHLFRPLGEEQRFRAGDRPGFFELEGVGCGVMICYDLRFPELARSLALSGARVLFVPAQWPRERLAHWRALLLARAIENQVFVVGCNATGSRGGETFGGASLIIDPWGRILAEGGAGEDVVQAELDLAGIEVVRRLIPVFADRIPSAYPMPDIQPPEG